MMHVILWYSLYCIMGLFCLCHSYVIFDVLLNFRRASSSASREEKRMRIVKSASKVTLDFSTDKKKKGMGLGQM